ncbi:uncharacterized protein [Salminus brasiliensis]|uniref:uncharacterized protein n=1 Tax=Salminus brasiliensis TaxID=930266 RepID=UPI003B82FC94
MKIIFLFTLHLISGPVGCFDVIGFPGGEVKITCQYQNSAGAQKNFCKLRTPQECGNSILTPFGQFNTGVNRGRFSLVDNPVGALTATIRHLSSWDSGLYRCAEAGDWSYDVNLVVKKDSCCLRSKTVTGYLGETVTINCFYPGELQNKTKFLYKQYGQLYREVIRSSDSQKDRFSISDDKSSKVVSVRISDVREEDGGVYSCAVSAGGEPVSYYTRYTEIQLQVSGSFVIIIVSVCAVLLLIGGLTLIFYRCIKKQGFTSSSNRRDVGSNSEIMPDYEEIKDTRRHLDTEATHLYATVQQPPAYSDPLKSVYSTAQLPTTPTDTLKSVYATAQLPTTPTDPLKSVYATAQLPTTPTDTLKSVYATAQLPTTPTDPLKSVYATAQLPTIPSDCLDTVQATPVPYDLPNDKVGSIRVVGFSGGQTILKFKYPLEEPKPMFICKESEEGCSERTYLKVQNAWQQNGEISLYDDTSKGFLMVFVRNVLEETYRCGTDVLQFTEQYIEVKMEVMEDPCCGKVVSQTGYLGKTVNITCHYPPTYRSNPKHFCKEDEDHICQGISATGKYSLSDHSQVGLLKVSINNLTSTDAGVYWCGVETTEGSISYTSQTLRIRLSVNCEQISSFYLLK